jgi:predicted nuclease with TOPRIM domain
MTAAKLAIEKENRVADLEKIRTLETRIDKEMETVQEGISRMEDEMENKFSRFNELRENFEQEKQRIVVIRALVAKYKT